MNTKNYFGTTVKSLYTTFLILLFLVCFTSSGWGITMSATYQGMTQDVVGRGNQATPNGQGDGHFIIRLELGNQRRVVTYMVLESANANGYPSGGQVWDTSPNGYWILGVYRGNYRLNPADRNIRDAVGGSVRYDIFGNNSGWFRTGQHFRITVKFADGGSAAAVCRVGASSGNATLQATYRGMSRDVVGRGGQAGSNRQPDGHFSLRLNLGNQRRVVTYMVLESANSSGHPSGGQVWDTTPNRFWILGVYRGSYRLNPTDRNIRDSVSGSVQYDIYGNDSGWFRAGQHFRITVKFEDGTQVSALVRL